MPGTPDAFLTRTRFVRVLSALALLLVAAMLGSALVGAEPIHLGRALFGGAADNLDRVILLRIRLPRVLLAVLVGGAGGMASLLLVPAGAFAGALLAMGLVYRLGSVHGRLQPYMFLLAGVVTNAFAGALIMTLNAVADFFQAQGILFWLLGSLQTQSYGLVAASAVYLVIGVLWLMRHTRAFNVLTLGEEGAAQLGIDVAQTRRSAFVVSSLLVGASVSVSGMIGFVGLIVPHVTRLLIGPDYRLLLPAAVLTGATFLLLADTVARSAFGATEIPVGVVTALCGGPFFIYLLRREGGRGVE